MKFNTLDLYARWMAETKLIAPILAQKGTPPFGYFERARLMELSRRGMIFGDIMAPWLKQFQRSFERHSMSTEKTTQKQLLYHSKWLAAAIFIITLAIATINYGNPPVF